MQQGATMSPLQRSLLFLVGCLGSRAALAWAAGQVSQRVLYWMGVLALLPALGFMLIWACNLRPTGVEAGGAIWWNNLRPLHGAAYFAFALLAMTGRQRAAMWVLVADVLLGLVAWMAHKAGVL